jgi:3-oxoacyl-[acyl-carrier-protein] synthase-1
MPSPASAIQRGLRRSHGFRSQVWGAPTLDPTEMVDRRAMRFLSRGGAWNHVAMKQAIEDAGLEETEISHERTGIVMGSGGPSTRTLIDAADITRKNGSPKRIGPFAVPKAMSSTASATLATWFKIHGVNYSISSACSTSAHCIGNAAELIQWGKQDMVFAGGHEDLDWSMSNLFDAMGAMSSKYNETSPATASRAYDISRDGFVIAGGAGVLVLEELEHAKARGAKIYAETDRLRRNLGRLRHGGPVGRGRGALHAPGDWLRSRAGSITSTPTAPRRRLAIPRKSARSAKSSATTCRMCSRPNR